MQLVGSPRPHRSSDKCDPLEQLRQPPSSTQTPPLQICAEVVKGFVGFGLGDKGIGTGLRIFSPPPPVVLFFHVADLRNVVHIIWLRRPVC